MSHIDDSDNNNSGITKKQPSLVKFFGVNFHWVLWKKMYIEIYFSTEYLAELRGTLLIYRFRVTYVRFVEYIHIHRHINKFYSIEKECKKMCGNKARDLFCYFLLFRRTCWPLFSLLFLSHHHSLHKHISFTWFLRSFSSLFLHYFFSKAVVCCQLLSCFRTELLVPTIYGWFVKNSHEIHQHHEQTFSFRHTFSYSFFHLLLMPVQ